MAKRLGTGSYQYESVDDWPKEPIPGVASDVATDSQDRVYVAVRTAQEKDNNTGAVLVFDRDGNLLKTFGEDKLRSPHGLWMTPEDELFHTDAFDHSVRKYSLDGELLMTMGVPGQPGPAGQPFNMPTCTCPSASGDLFVSDGYRQSRVHRFSSDGDLQLSWGSGDLNLYDEMVFDSQATPGTGPGEFHLPHGVTIDSNDRAYVMDRSNNRTQVFDYDGNYLNEWDTGPMNKAVIDGDGIMHLVGRGGVNLWSLEGDHIGNWGESGDEPWQFSGGPHGVWIDSHSDIYVAQVGAENAFNKFARV